MPANIFLIPLLAGYLFVHISNRFRFRAQSLDGYRLLIESATAGVVLLGAARLLTLLLGVAAPGLYRFWHDRIVPDPNLAYLGTAILSFFLGISAPLIYNRLPRLGLCSRAVRRSEEHTSELQSRQYLVCRLLLGEHVSTAVTPISRMPSSRWRRRMNHRAGA